eukprot:s2114_g11.t1
MNLKKAGFENEGDRNHAEEGQSDSLDTQAVHVQVPGNIDGLFGGSELESLHLDLMSEGSAHENTGAMSSDGYYDPEDEKDEPLGADSLTDFLSLITDVCLSVPSVSVKPSYRDISIKAKKLVELADLNRCEKRQARVLTVKEVEALELTLLDEKEELTDRYAAGFSDLKKVRGYYTDDKALLPAPLDHGEQAWQDRAVTTTEAGKWLRSMLSKRLGEIEYTTVHTLKSTPLSWCAKAGLDPTTRLLLGHHVTGKHSADVYARDVLAVCLRDFEAVLQRIRNGSLMPDATRSGMVGNAIRSDPKETYVADKENPTDPADEGSGQSSSESSSDAESSSNEIVPQLMLPNNPVAEERHWDPDLDMFQHSKSKIVHVRAVGSQQEPFSLEVNLTETEIDAIIGGGVTSLARLAFAAAPPGTTPTDDQVRSLFGGVLVPNVEALASMKRLVFEAQTLVVADVKSKVSKKDEQIPSTMAPAERENRVVEQRKRLTGVRLRGE